MGTMLHGKYVDLKLDEQGTDRKSERQHLTNLVFTRRRFWQAVKKVSSAQLSLSSLQEIANTKNSLQTTSKT